MSRKRSAHNARALLALDLFVVAACVYYLIDAVAANDGSQGVVAFVALLSMVELTRYHYRERQEAE